MPKRRPLKLNHARNLSAPDVGSGILLGKWGHIVALLTAMANEFSNGTSLNGARSWPAMLGDK